MREIKEEHLKEYLTAVCEDFFTDYKEQKKCSAFGAMSVVVSAVVRTLSAMVDKMKEIPHE